MARVPKQTKQEPLEVVLWKGVIVKRLLKKYGYPPDMALLATETVLEQAEQLAEELANAA
ncbi:DUF3387 domain-containing protein [Acinetobacter nosocomialis]